MRILCVGDLHFGIKSNSISWLETQLDFFNRQLFDIIDSKNIDRIVFLGDVFDIRYSINQQIGIEVKQVFRTMLQRFTDKQFIIVAGNHDYYSPLEEFATYNAYRLCFDEEFLQIHKNLTVVDMEPLLLEDGSLFLPWYWTENPDHFDEILYNYDFEDEVKAIFCHADLVQWPGARIAALKGCPIYSGHIHNIQFDEFSHLYNLGAAFPLTFNDVNEYRYVWIVEDFRLTEKIRNTTTPLFKRIYNDDIFTADETVFTNSYVQICISASNINKPRYVEHIKNLKLTYVDSNIRLHVIDDDTDIKTLSVEGFNTNINQYIEDNIPEHLDNKYKLIKNKLNDTQE